MTDCLPVVRVLSPREIAEVAISWAAAEGWNPGLTDHASFPAADSTGFLGLFIGEEAVGCISAVRYDPDFAFLGFYIIKPEWRGRGLGWTLWQHAMQRLERRVVGLDGVLAQQENYTKSGFRFAHRNIRFEGISGGLTAAESGSGCATRVEESDYPEVEAYDARHFPVRRHAFLRAWLAQPATVSYAVRDAGALRGYGSIRPCLRGWKIGPLFADDESVAETLLQRLTAGLPASTPFFLDVCEANAAALSLAGRHSLRRAFETARMYKGPAPALPLHQIFGVTSFELG